MPSGSQVSGNIYGDVLPTYMNGEIRVNINKRLVGFCGTPGTEEPCKRPAHECLKINGTEDFYAQPCMNGQSPPRVNETFAQSWKYGLHNIQVYF